MKKVLMIILIMAVCVGFSYSASIAITNPVAGAGIAKDSTVVITWNAIDTTNGFKITLWKNNALLSVIQSNYASGSGNRTYPWIANVDCGTGYQIKIKEKTTTVSDMTGNFNITGCLRTITPALSLQQDLEIKELFTRNGMLFAKVKSNFGNFKKKVEFMVVPPVLRIEKNLDLRGNNIKNIAICRLNHFSLRAGFVSCMIDSNLKINETNERNNTKNIVSDWKDLTISCVLIGIKKHYLYGSHDYTVSYKMILKNKSNIGLRNIKIDVIVSTVGKEETYTRVNRYENLAPFEEKTISFHQVFSRKEYIRDKTYYPLLKKGSSYRFVFRIDSNNTIEEINKHNNSCVSEFKLTK